MSSILTGTFPATAQSLISTLLHVSATDFGHLHGAIISHTLSVNGKHIYVIYVTIIFNNKLFYSIFKIVRIKINIKIQVVY
jgi:hypothetical protein